MTGRLCEQHNPDVITTHIWTPFNLGDDVILTLFAIDCTKAEFCAMCVCARVCAGKCERGRHSHTTAACVQTHTSFITVSITRLCSHLWLELMVNLRTLLTVFTLILKTKARDYGKGALRFRCGLWCLVNHNALCQLANQSRLHLSEGGTL